MPLPVVEVREPPDALDADEPLAFLVHAARRRLQRIVVRHAELAVAAVDARAEPEPVGLDEGKYFLVRERVDVSDDEELLAVPDELGDVFAEERERRVRDDDIGLLQERDALRAAEVAVTPKCVDADLLRVGDAVFARLAADSPLVPVMVAFRAAKQPRQTKRRTSRVSLLRP